MSLAVGTLLSSYTKAINIERERSGSLFRCKTKIKPISLEMDQGKYLFTCFDYIHNNPLEAGLVNNPLEYQFSSALEYAGLVDDGLCHVDIITAHFLDSA
jgi:putative transposase